ERENHDRQQAASRRSHGRQKRTSVPMAEFPNGTGGPGPVVVTDRTWWAPGWPAAGKLDVWVVSPAAAWSTWLIRLPVRSYDQLCQYGTAPPRPATPGAVAQLPDAGVHASVSRRRWS